jgi:actin related protein 2/3 complex subunit 5
VHATRDSASNISSQAVQEVTLQTLLTILNTTKSTEISAVIKSLSQDNQDTLMKYLYKGMAMPGWGDISGSVLLGWHEKVCLPLLFHAI